MQEQDMNVNVNQDQLFRIGKIIEDSLNEVFIFNAETLEFIYVNYGAQANLGYSQEELRHLTPIDINEGFSRSSFKKFVLPLKEGKESRLQFETKHTRKDGSLYDVEVHLQMTEYNNQPAFVAIIMDITPRKKTEEKLQETKKYYEALFNRSFNGVFICDMEGNFIDANEATLNWTGYVREDIKKLSFANLFGADQLIEVYRIMEDLITSGSQGKPVVFEIKTKNGEGIWVETLGSLIYKDGEPVAIQGIARNITERIQTELHLKKHNTLLKKQNDLLHQFSIDQKLIDLSLSKKFEKITRDVSKSLDVARVSIWSIEESGNRLLCRDLYESINNKHSKGHALMSCHYPAYFRAMQDEAVIIANNAFEDKRTAEFSEHYLKLHGIISMMDTPININGTLYGVLCLEHTGKERQWSIDEENFVATTADLISHLIISESNEKNIKRLRDSEEKYRGYIEHAPDGVFISDEEGNYVDVNKAACEITGYSKDELIGMHINDIAYEEKHMMNALKQIKNTGKNNINSKYRKKDGSVRFWALDMVKLSNTLFLGFAKDITKRVEAENLLNQASKIINESPVATIRWRNSKGWPVEYVSDNIVNLTGYTAQQMISGEIDYMKIVHPSDKKRLAAEVKDYSIKKHKIEYTHPPYRLVTRKGNIIWIEDTTNVIKNENGEITHYEGIIQDITDHVNAKDQIHQSMDRFYAIIKGIKQGMIIIDKKGVIQYANPAVTKITGMNTADIVGQYGIKQARKFISIKQMPKILKYTSLLLASKNPRPIEIKFNDRVLYFHTIINLKQQGFVVIFDDTTERKEAEGKIRDYSKNLQKLVKERTREIESKNIRLEESQIALTYLLEDVNDTRMELQSAIKRMQEANQELESFSYSVSHDLKAPLRAIDGFSQMLIEDYADKLDEDGKRYLNVVRENTQNMGKLIQDLLDFSRAGRSRLNPEEINLRDMITQILDEVLALEKDRRIDVDVGKLPLVVADKTLLRQVLSNIISNAVKFTRNNDVTNIHIWFEDKEKEFEIYVKDNGIGFDMKYEQKLFLVFQRLHTIDQFEGTGVGLALVKRIICRFGGEITAQGVPNQGATFRFTLPKTDKL